MASEVLVNSAHVPGLTTANFSRDGKKLYTAGDDALVRVWDASKDASQEPRVVDEADEGITSLDCSAESWISASQDSNVRKYNAANDSFAGLITRSPGVSIRAITFSPDGNKIAVASEELHVKIIDAHDPLTLSLLNGHTNGVRAATWDPSGTLLTTSGQDGSVKIWTITSESSISPTHSIEGLISEIDTNSPEFMYNAAAMWHPNGRYFVIPSKTHEIAVIQNELWTKAGTFSKGGHNGAITALSFSSNGEYLASAGQDGYIFIWSTATRSVLFRREAISNVTIPSIRFSPTANLLVWTDVDGSLTRWREPIPPTHSHPSRLPSSLASKTPETKVISHEGQNHLNDMFDEVGENLGGVGGDLKDKMALDNDGGDMYDDGWVIDDDDEPGNAAPYRVGQNEAMDQDERGPREMVNVTKAQPAFQPGSTPFRNKKKYLAFNMIGVIECTDQETHNIINVEFHDKLLRRGYHFSDSFRYTIASLGPRGALYACPPEKGTSSRGQVHYRPYDTWASSPEWSVELNQGEVPVAVCAGGAAYKKRSDTDEYFNEDEEDAQLRRGPKDAGGTGYAIVALSNSRVHIWLGTGIHMYMMTIGGDVVAMAASAEWLFIIHREGGTSLDGCQNLRYTLMTLDSYDTIKEGAPIPLGKGVTLKWMGFTEEEAPAIYDSQGVLHILDRFRRPTQGRWVPLLDTNTLARREGKDESYWPVGVSLTEFSCIILKGREQHPSFPRPLIQELEIRMPGYNMDNAKGQSEERLIREQILVQIERDALPPSIDITSQISQQELDLDKVLITLIQTSCKGDKLDRALDYTSRLHHLASFDLAQKVAEFYHLPGLKERMRRLKESRERAEGIEVEDGRLIREGWGRVLEPVPRAGVAELEPTSRERYTSYGGGRASDVNGRDSLEFPPQPAMPRRSLAQAPAYASTKSYDPRDVSSPSSVPHDDPFTADSSMAETQDTFNLASKRKHGEDSESYAPRKRASPVSERTPAAAPVVKANPFARRKAPEATPSNSNPFARGGGKPLNALKSNSFFEKVDLAEDQVSQPPKGRAAKTKDKKDVGRQTTLFGFQPQAAEKPVAHKRAPKENGNADSVETAQVAARKSPAPEATANTLLPRSPSLVADEEDSQATIEEGFGETQPASYLKEQRQGSPDWEPTGEDFEMSSDPAVVSSLDRY